MTLLTFMTGIVIIIFSMMLMSGFFSNNEWRAPLLELSFELGKNPLDKELQSGYKRRSFLIVVFFLILYLIGCLIVLTSAMLHDYKTIKLIILGIILLWLLKGAYELIRAFYSKKTRLRNYLFSPYFFAWRRDNLYEYSDQEIAEAICRVCNIHDSSLLQENTNLKDFLIVLYQNQKPFLNWYFENLQDLEESDKYEGYSKILEENIAQAKK